MFPFNYVKLRSFKIFDVEITAGYIVDSIFENPWPNLAILSVVSLIGIFLFWLLNSTLNPDKLVMFLSHDAQLTGPNYFFVSMPPSP